MDCLTNISTPWGNIVIETTDLGVSAVRFVEPYSCPTLGKGTAAASYGAAAACELSAYFEGQLRKFTVPVDLSWATPFSRDIYSALMQIPFGHTISYGRLAEAAGRPGCARAAGRAMAENCAPIIIPCHRVISSDGRLGGWSGPDGFKQRLHAHERISIGRGIHIE